MSGIIGYTYEADVHCVACTVERFGEEPGRGWVREDAVDNEGNAVHPVFSWDVEQDEWCGTCGEKIA